MWSFSIAPDAVDESGVGGGWSLQIHGCYIELAKLAIILPPNLTDRGAKKPLKRKQELYRICPSIPEVLVEFTWVGFSATVRGFPGAEGPASTVSRCSTRLVGHALVTNEAQRPQLA